MQPTHDSSIPVSIFYSYSHKDKSHRDRLKTHLSVMKRQGLISEWHDQDIMPGQEWHGEINKYLKNADIILFLVSSDFLDSDYCSTVEMDVFIYRAQSNNASLLGLSVDKLCNLYFVFYYLWTPFSRRYNK